MSRSDPIPTETLTRWGTHAARVRDSHQALGYEHSFAIRIVALVSEVERWKQVAEIKHLAAQEMKNRAERAEKKLEKLGGNA